MSHTYNRGKHNFMPRIGNTEHMAETNNGYKRKDNGTFFCH